MSRDIYRLRPWVGFRFTCTREVLPLDHYARLELRIECDTQTCDAYRVINHVHPDSYGFTGQKFEGDGDYINYMDVYDKDSGRVVYMAWHYSKRHDWMTNKLKHRDELSRDAPNKYTNDPLDWVLGLMRL